MLKHTIATTAASKSENKPSTSDKPSSSPNVRTGTGSSASAEKEKPKTPPNTTQTNVAGNRPVNVSKTQVTVHKDHAVQNVNTVTNVHNNKPVHKVNIISNIKICSAKIVNKKSTLSNAVCNKTTAKTNAPATVKPQEADNKTAVSNCLDTIETEVYYTPPQTLTPRVLPAPRNEILTNTAEYTATPKVSAGVNSN